MKATLEQMQTALQNSANELNLKVNTYYFEDKRKNPMFCVYSAICQYRQKWIICKQICFCMDSDKLLKSIIADNNIQN